MAAPWKQKIHEPTDCGDAGVEGFSSATVPTTSLNVKFCYGSCTRHAATLTACFHCCWRFGDIIRQAQHRYRIPWNGSPSAKGSAAIWVWLIPSICNSSSEVEKDYLWRNLCIHYCRIIKSNNSCKPIEFAMCSISTAWVDNGHWIHPASFRLAYY